MLGAPDAAFALSPNGAQFQVNSFTTYYQQASSVASDSAGNFVVVWESGGTVNAPFSVQGQRYNSSGSPIGRQFQVNTYTTGNQRKPSVASDPAGHFVAVWQGVGGFGSDTTTISIQGQRFDASGSPIGGQFQVNTYTPGIQDYPRVASDSAGNFVVVWGSQGGVGGDTSGFSVEGQRYNSSGSLIGGEFQVNTYTTNDQSDPWVASDSAGNFVVVWYSVGADGSGFSVEAQRYSSSGAPIGGEFQVNTYTTNNQFHPSVASGSSGDFVVTWASVGSAGTDTSFSSIQAQRYAANGTPIGGEFQVNTYTTSSQYYPRVASDSSGDFLVVWQSQVSGGDDSSSWSVQGQLYDASGTPVGGQFQVNTYTTSVQTHPAVASDTTGRSAVVVWQSTGSPSTDSSFNSVQGQRYLPEPSFAQSLGVMLCMAAVFARRGKRIGTRSTHSFGDGRSAGSGN